MTIAVAFVLHTSKIIICYYYYLLILRCFPHNIAEQSVNYCTYGTWAIHS